MAQSERAVDDSFLDDVEPTTDDSFLDDSFLDEVDEPPASLARDLSPVASPKQISDRELADFYAKQTGEMNNRLAALGKGAMRLATLGGAKLIGGLGADVVDKWLGDLPPEGPARDAHRAKSQQYINEWYDSTAEEYPFGTGLGMAIGGGPAAMALAPYGMTAAAARAGAGVPALMAGGAADAALMGGVMGGLDSSSGNMEGRMYDAAAGAVAAAPLGAAGPVLPEIIGSIPGAARQVASKVVGAAGKAARVPKTAHDAASMKAGKFLLENEGAAAPGLEDELVTEAALEKLGAEGAEAFQAGAAKVDPEILRKPFLQLQAQEADQVANAVVVALKSKGLPVDKPLAEVLMADMAKETGAATGGDVLKLVIHHDPANVARRLMTAHERYAPVLKGLGVKTDPRWLEAYERVAGLRGDMEAGKLNRVFSDASTPNIKVASKQTAPAAPEVVTAPPKPAPTVEPQVQVAKPAADGSMPVPVADKPPKFSRKDPGLLDDLGDHSVVMPAPRRVSFKNKEEAWNEIQKAGGIDDYDSLKADMAYERWKQGRGPKPPPFTSAGHFDEINGLLNATGDQRVSGAREAFDRLTKGITDWGALDEKVLTKIQRIPGFKNARLPDDIQQAIMPPQPPPELDDSFDFGANRWSSAPKVEGRISNEQIDDVFAQGNEMLSVTNPQAAEQARGWRPPTDAEVKATAREIELEALAKLSKKHGREFTPPDANTRTTVRPDADTGVFESAPDVDVTKSVAKPAPPEPPPASPEVAEKAAETQQKVAPWEAAEDQLAALRRGQKFVPGGKWASRLDQFGRGLEGFAKRMSPESAAAKLAADPAKLQQMAQQPTKLGRAAKFVLEGGDQEGIRARSYVLSMQPWFREMMADTDEQDPGSSAATSP